MKIKTRTDTKKTKFEVGDKVWVVRKNGWRIEVDKEEIRTISAVCRDSFIFKDINITYNLDHDQIKDENVLFATEKQAKAEMNRLFNEMAKE